MRYFLPTDTKVKKEPQVNAIYLDQSVAAEMMWSFLDAATEKEEEFCLLSGIIQDGIGYVTTVWGNKVVEAGPVTVEPETGWLSKCANEMIRLGHNIYIESHRHPIGFRMSSLDRSSLRVISEWLRGTGLKPFIICRDIDIAAYCEDEHGKVVRIPVRVYKPGYTLSVPRFTITEKRSMIQVQEGLAGSPVYKKISKRITLFSIITAFCIGFIVGLLVRISTLIFS
ncbi:MAG: hypothetical protein ABDH32_01175 [Candidatus Caldarchaeales archaeon]